MSEVFTGTTTEMGGEEDSPGGECESPNYPQDETMYHLNIKIILLYSFQTGDKKSDFQILQVSRNVLHDSSNMWKNSVFDSTCITCLVSSVE